MKRPRGVTIIGCLLLVQGLVSILTISVIVAVHVPALAEQLPRTVLSSIDATSTSDVTGFSVYAVVGILALTGGFALLLMRSWAWTVAMLVQGYALVINLWSFFQGQDLYLQMLLAIVIVFYLNTREVRHAFQARQHPIADAALPSAPGSSDTSGTSASRGIVGTETTPQSVPG